VGEAEEGAEDGSKPLDGAAGVPAAGDPPDQALVDLGGGQVGEGVPGPAEGVEKPLGNRAVVLPGPGRQPPLADEVVGERVDLGGVRARPGGRQLQAAEEAEEVGGVLAEQLARRPRAPVRGGQRGPVRPAGGLRLDVVGADGV
jgi:hypothetical protein